MYILCLLLCVGLVGLAKGESGDPPPPLNTRFSSVELFVSAENGSCATSEQREDARRHISKDIREQLVNVPQIFIDCNKYNIGRYPHCAVDNCSVVFDQMTLENGLIYPSGFFWLKIPNEEARLVFCNRKTGFPEMPSCKLLFSYHPTADSGVYSLLLSDGVRSTVYCNRENNRPEPESCAHAHQLELPTGDYILRPPPDNLPLNYTVHCDMNREECGSDGWTEVISLNFSNHSTPCPQNWQLKTSPIRGCHRTIENGCSTAKFSTHKHNYTRVCGRVLAHQHGRAFGFFSSTFNDDGIDGNYVNGVSVTRGESPRQHIWTFAASLESSYCQCNDENVTHPSFIGNHYFCESGGTTEDDNPLWNGKGCSLEDGCCMFNNPPWFSTKLPNATTEDIEFRLCGIYDLSNYTIPISLIELFVQ